MNTLVVYYTRSGNTKKTVETLSRMISCDVLEIDDGINRKGIIGWIRSGYQGASKKTFPLKPIDKDPVHYDMVILCTPIWAGTMASPIRKFVKDHGDKIRRHSILCSQGDTKEQRIFEDMKNLMKRDEHARGVIADKWWKDGTAETRLREFVHRLG